MLAELCLPLVRPGGHWVAAKGAAPQDEVAAAAGAIGKMGGKLLGVEEVDSGAAGCTAARKGSVLGARRRPWNVVASLCGAPLGFR